MGMCNNDKHQIPTSSEDSISDSLLNISSIFVSMEDGGGGSTGGDRMGTDFGRGGVGNAFRNGAGIFILFIKCNTCIQEYTEKSIPENVKSHMQTKREKKGAQNRTDLSVKARNCDKSIYDVSQDVTIRWWVCISVS